LLTTGALLTPHIFRSHLNRSALELAHVPAATKIRPRVAIDADYQYVLRVHRGSESCRKTRRVRVGVVAILQPVRLRRAVRFSHPDLPLGRFMDSAPSRSASPKSTVRALFSGEGSLLGCGRHSTPYDRPSLSGRGTGTAARPHHGVHTRAGRRRGSQRCRPRPLGRDR